MEPSPRRRAETVSLVPYGLNEQHPNHYLDMLKVLRDNRDNLGYAWRILRDGCCDGCSLGTTGMRGPFTPGSDDPQVGRERLEGQLKPHLIVPFPVHPCARASAPCSEGHLHLGFGDHRPGEGSSQQVLAFIDRARLDGFPKVAGYKLLAEVLDKDFGSAAGQSFSADGGVIVALTNVSDHGDDFAAVIFTQPGNNDGGIKPP